MSVVSKENQPLEYNNLFTPSKKTKGREGKKKRYSSCVVKVCGAIGVFGYGHT